MRSAYSTQPLARHIPELKQDRPQFRTQEEYAEAMKAEAKKTMRRFDFERTQDLGAPPLVDISVIAFLKDRPRASVFDIADHFDREFKSVAPLLSRMALRGMVQVEFGKAPETGRPCRVFTATEKGLAKKVRGPKRKHQNKTEIVADFIRKNPGLTSHEIADALDMTSREVSSTVSNLRQRARDFEIISERIGRDRRLPARYWIKGRGE